MPVYNSDPEYFGRAIDSLLMQTFGDFELILSDNGSDRDRAAMYVNRAAKDSRIRYVRQSINLGPIFNFNFVAREARGRYFLWASDDDLRDVEYLELTSRMLEQRPEYVSVGSGVLFFGEPEVAQDAARFDPIALDNSASRRVLAIANGQNYLDIYALHRREALLRAGPVEHSIAPDFSLVARLLVLGRMGRVERALFRYRRRAEHTLEHYVEILNVGAPVAIATTRWHREVGLLMLRSIWTVDAPIEIRLACVMRLGHLLARSGSFFVDDITASRSRFEAFLNQGKIGRAVLEGLRYGALSPQSILRRQAWKRLLRILPGSTYGGRDVAGEPY